MKVIIINILLLYNFLAYAQETNIEIVWKSPTINNFKTSIKNFNLQACINSNEKIKEVSLFVNKKLVKNIAFGSDIIFRGKCDIFINENIELNNGTNDVKIFAKSESYLIERSIVINYEFISAKYYALIIAVQDYDDEKINDLSEPVNDAIKLKKELLNNYTFEEANVKFLTNPKNSEIIGVLHKMRSYITNNDNLLIFYAGHGFWDEGMKTGYWLPRDSEKDNPVNWLANNTLTNYISAINSKHTLLIADACFSGGIFKTRSAFNIDQVTERLYQLPSRKAMTSGTLKEVPDKSVFIEYLLKRLNENDEKYLTSEQLFSNLRPAVLNNSSNIPQYGTIQNTGDEGGDFIFIKKKSTVVNEFEKTVLQKADITSEIISNKEYQKLLDQKIAKEKAELEASLKAEEKRKAEEIEKKKNEQNRINAESLAKQKAKEEAEALAKKNAETDLKQKADIEDKKNTEEKPLENLKTESQSKNNTNVELNLKTKSGKTEIVIYHNDFLESINIINQKNIATIYKGINTTTKKVKKNKKYYLFTPAIKKIQEQNIGKIEITDIDSKKIIGNITLNKNTIKQVIDKNVIFRTYLPKNNGVHNIIRLNTFQINRTRSYNDISNGNGNVMGETSTQLISPFNGFESINGFMFSFRTHNSYLTNIEDGVYRGDYYTDYHMFFGIGTGYNEEYHQPFLDAKINNIPLFLNLKISLTKEQLLWINFIIGKNFVTKGSNNLRPYTVNGNILGGIGIELKKFVSDYGAFTIGADYEYKNYNFENYSRYNSVGLQFVKIKVGFEPYYSIFD